MLGFGHLRTGSSSREAARPSACRPEKSAHSRPLCSANGEKARLLICP